jgi:hypothetical protein
MDLQDISKPSENYAKVDGASPEAGTRRTLSAALQRQRCAPVMPAGGVRVL